MLFLRSISAMADEKILLGSLNVRLNWDVCPAFDGDILYRWVIVLVRCWKLKLFFTGGQRCISRSWTCCPDEHRWWKGIDVLKTSVFISAGCPPATPPSLVPSGKITVRN
jgi:hypothetical protein